MSCPVPVADAGPDRVELLRAAGRDLGARVLALCPPGPTRDAALLHLREAVYHARAAVLQGDRP